MNEQKHNDPRVEAILARLDSALGGKPKASSTAKGFPFGKYAGELIETVLADKGYCHWLLAQARFKKEHPALYATVLEAHADFEPAEKQEKKPAAKKKKVHHYQYLFEKYFPTGNEPKTFKPEFPSFNLN